MNLRDRIEKKHLVIATIIFCTFIVIGCVISILFTHKQEPAQDAGAGDEIYAYSAIFSNRYQLNQIYGKDNAAIVLTQIEAIIFSDNALATAPHQNQSPDEFDKHYAVILDETSFKKYTDYPEVYTFTVSLSDGRIYDAYTRQDIERDPDTDERSIRVSTILKSGDNIYFETNATADSVLDKNLMIWRDRF